MRQASAMPFPTWDDDAAVALWRRQELLFGRTAHLPLRVVEWVGSVTAKSRIQD